MNYKQTITVRSSVTSMPVLVILRRKCTLAASRETVTLRLPLDAASIINKV